MIELCLFLFQIAITWLKVGFNKNAKFQFCELFSTKKKEIE